MVASYRLLRLAAALPLESESPTAPNMALRVREWVELTEVTKARLCERAPSGVTRIGIVTRVKHPVFQSKMARQGFNVKPSKILIKSASSPCE